jgi:hypothetical protein
MILAEFAYETWRALIGIDGTQPWPKVRPDVQLMWRGAALTAIDAEAPGEAARMAFEQHWIEVELPRLWQEMHPTAQEYWRWVASHLKSEVSQES